MQQLSPWHLAKGFLLKKAPRRNHLGAKLYNRLNFCISFFRIKKLKIILHFAFCILHLRSIYQMAISPFSS